MKGLLIKDFQFLMQQKKTWVIMLIVSIMILFSNSDIPFVIGYVTMVASFVAIGTISYDEMDNGYTFLFTLPIDIKGYVLTKYILSVMISVVALGIANVLCMLVSKELFDKTDLGGTVLILLLALLMQFVVIPVQLKFGVEKSRIVYLTFAGVLLLFGAFFEQFSAYLPDMSGLVIWVESLQFGEVAGLLALFTMIAALISFGSSCRVMSRKQL